MHPQARQWVADHVTKVGSPVRVMDQGGQNVNGGIKDLFPTATDWTAVDMFPGQGVDLVMDCGDYIHPNCDLVTTTELLEHTPRGADIVQRAFDSLKPGGHYLVTTAGPGRAAHSAQGLAQIPKGEYYGNISPEKLRDWLKDAGFVDIIVNEEKTSHDTRAWARRPGPKPMTLPANINLTLSDTITVTDLWQMRLRSHTSDTYRGRRLSKFPEDLRTYQHLIESTAPDVIVELGSQDGGSAMWFADQLQTFFGKGEVISVDVTPVRPLEQEGISFIRGDLADPTVVEKVTELVDGRYCMVIEDSAHTYPVTLAALNLYSHLVHGSQWFVVEDGVVDEWRLRQPNWPHGVQQAIADFIASEQGKRFTQFSLMPYGLTCHHGGWLRSLG